MMALYKVWVCLEEEYDDIEADSEEDVFIQASDVAMNCGCWRWEVEKIEEAQNE